MLNLFLLWMWIGGMGPAYAKHRSLGQGMLTAGFDAIIWPGGVGQYIALKFYREW
jgi:hypothetical protein